MSARESKGRARFRGADRVEWSAADNPGAATKSGLQQCCPNCRPAAILAMAGRQCQQEQPQSHSISMPESLSRWGTPNLAEKLAGQSPKLVFSPGACDRRE